LDRESGKTLQAVYITHGHGDHWFGAGPLLDRFPGARLYALPDTIAMMKVHGSPEFRAALWDKQFPGVVPATTSVEPTPPPGGSIDLEGHELVPIEVGHTDTDDTTVLHVPALNLVVAGDVVYDNVHQYLREAQGDGIERWLAALDMVAELSPSHVISGHEDKSKCDDPATIGQTRDYLLAARRQLESAPTPLEFFETMLETFPHRLNPGALWSSAVALLA
jgi:glyoxylase-like metal-dependent hydrolase (beta-lactamase superfamily II)